MRPVMMVPWIVVLIGSGVLLAALFGVIALLANPRTRVVGIVLMVVPLPLALLAAVYLFVAPSEVHYAQQEATREAETIRAEATWRREVQRGHEVPGYRAVPDGSAVEVTARSGDVPPVQTQGVIPVPDAKKPSPAAPSSSSPSKPSSAEVKRPDWVGQRPHRVSGVYQMAVATDPGMNRQECEADMPEVLNQAVAKYVNEVYLPHNSEAARRVRLPLDFIRSRLVKEEWEEPVEVSLSEAPLVRLHALLEFDRTANTRIDDAWQKAVVQHRVWNSAAVLGGLLTVLAVAWGYLKIDLATSGTYRWRLRILAALAILGVVFAGLAMLRGAVVI